MCASNLAWFMAGRMLQGLAASSYVVIHASMRDCFDDPASRQQAMGRMLLGLWDLFFVLVSCMGYES